MRPCVLAGLWVWPLPWLYGTRDGTDADAAVCFHSLLTNLRKLTLFRAAVSLPALQLVATRLHGLNLVSSRLQGSADGFLTRGWTALTRLSLAHADMEAATMTAAPELPALEELNMKGFRHQGGALQLDQLIGGCPHVRGLSFLLDDYMIRGREGSRPCGSLQSLGQLADLCIWTLVEPPNANFDLPAGLTHLQFADASGCGGVVDFFLALNEAAKCIRRGVHLRKVTCLQTEARLQPAQWGASLDEQYRRLGLQLTSLTELEVKDWCQKPLLSAVSAIVSSAPSLTRLILSITSIMPNMQLPAISSSSLESVTLELGCWDSPEPHPPVVLTFLPGCTRLQQVLVRFCGQLSAPTEGTAVEIRCHSASPMRIMPPDGHGYAGPISGMGVQFHPMPPSSQWVQAYTVIYTCHVALKQDHFVMPDVL